MTLEPEQRTDYIEVQQGRLFVEQIGAGDDVLLVHAGIADSRMWDDQIDALVRHFRVTRYDLRGFGQSSAADVEHSPVDDMAELIEALALDSPRVIAASMGARVTLDLALREPDLFSRLLLVGPAVSGLGFDDPALHACWNEMSAAWNAGDVERTIDIETRFWVNGPTRVDGSADESVLERVREMQRRIVELLPEEDLEIEADPPAFERLDQLTMPVLVIVGEHDVSDIHQNAEAIQATAPNALAVTLPSAGHLPNMEEVDEFNRLALEFLR